MLYFANVLFIYLFFMAALFSGPAVVVRESFTRGGP